MMAQKLMDPRIESDMELLVVNIWKEYNSIWLGDYMVKTAGDEMVKDIVTRLNRDCPGNEKRFFWYCVGLCKKEREKLPDARKGINDNNYLNSELKIHLLELLNLVEIFSEL